MFWLNLPTTALHAPEYIGSDPRARATWLNVSFYSASQENGGIVRGAKLWKDRQWQQTCGVTLREVMNAPLLLVWNGDDLEVWKYPHAQEEINRQKRETARENGRLGGRPKNPDAKPTSEPTSKPKSVPTSEPTSESVMERKEKEGKEKEWKPAGRPVPGISFRR